MLEVIGAHYNAERIERKEWKPKRWDWPEILAGMDLEEKQQGMLLGVKTWLSTLQIVYLSVFRRSH